MKLQQIRGEFKFNRQNLKRIEVTPTEEKIMRRRCEAAFRRGFSHGFLVGRNFKNGLTEQGVLKWRYDPDKRPLTPPGMDRDDWRG